MYAFKFNVHCGNALGLGASGPPYYCTPPVCQCVCVLLCFIKPILGNHYVRSRGFIVSEQGRRTHDPRSSTSQPSRVTVLIVLGALAVWWHNNNKTKISPGQMAQTPGLEPLAGLGGGVPLVSFLVQHFLDKTSSFSG